MPVQARYWQLMACLQGILNIKVASLASQTIYATVIEPYASRPLCMNISLISRNAPISQVPYFARLLTCDNSISPLEISTYLLIIPIFFSKELSNFKVTKCYAKKSAIISGQGCILIVQSVSEMGVPIWKNTPNVAYRVFSIC